MTASVAAVVPMLHRVGADGVVAHLGVVRVHRGFKARVRDLLALGHTKFMV